MFYFVHAYGHFVASVKMYFVQMHGQNTSSLMLRIAVQCALR